MSEQSSAAPAAPAAGTNASIPPPPKAAAAEGNPVFRMMGLPKFRARLPSRNWIIFLTLTGSFTAAVLYDKRERRRIQRRWCDLVSPIASETLPTTTLPRRVTIYLAAPPGDGLRAAREHFHEYVKPVLVAAALDWDVVEGRREGDVRYGTAERIRKLRRRNGEGKAEEGDDVDKEEVLREVREKAGTSVYEGAAGDVVIGRHAWKEYVRGLHEGWLGPVDKPVEESEQTAVDVPGEGMSGHMSGVHSLGDMPAVAATNLAAPFGSSLTSSSSPSTTDASTTPVTSDDDASPTASTTVTTSEPESQPEKPASEEPPKPKNVKPAPYIATSAYESAASPSSLPTNLGPSAAIPLPHLLGFWNFPIRIGRFLTRRNLADDIGRRVAAIALEQHVPYTSPSTVEGQLEHEEAEWHKSVRKRERADGEESVWLDPVVVDDRVAGRMRAFVLGQEEEQKAEALLRTPRTEASERTEE